MTSKDAYELAKASHDRAASVRVAATEQKSAKRLDLQRFAQIRGEQKKKRQQEELRLEQEARGNSSRGCLYFLSPRVPNAGVRRVKIGWSTNVPKRMKQAATFGAYQDDVLAVLLDIPRMDDAMYRKRFKHLRVWDAAGTEWFYLKEDLLEFIRQIPGSRL